MTAYDEFGLFRENAAEHGIDWEGPPTVRRESVALPSGLRLSALVWGEAEPELVLIHGGAQNAHTWDTVALALRRPLVAVDLPGHGRSPTTGPPTTTDRRRWLPTWPWPSRRWPPGPRRWWACRWAVSPPSAWPRTTRTWCAGWEWWTSRRARTTRRPSRSSPSWDGPEHFDSFEAILARTVEHNRTRSESSLRRGVLHNAQETVDGRWTWNYDRMRDWKTGRGPEPAFEDLWEGVGRITAPTALWQGGAWSVVGDDDVAEWMRRVPGTVHTVVEGAGHSIQGDRPLELVALIEDLLARPATALG